MKSFKWICLCMALALLTVFSGTGTLGDEADGNKLYIVQSELERSSNGLQQIPNYRNLLPISEKVLSKEQVTLEERFMVTDKANNSVNVNFLAEAEMYNSENVLDHIVVVTNTGNHVGYVRTWFAFEMGDLTEDEFEASVLLNQNTTQWTWGEFTYGVQINGECYAVICAKYNTALEGGATTAPNLLQILLKSDVANEVSNRLDGNNDGEYKVRVYSQAVSDDGAWSKVTSEPWNEPQPKE